MGYSDVIQLFDADGNEVDIADYNDDDWPTSSSERGHALELGDATSDNNDPSNWASSEAEGTYMYTEGGDAGEDFGTPSEQNSNYVDPCAGVVDECGVCDGPGAIYDCGCSGIPDGDCDCDGNTEDAVGECGGDCSSDADGDGVCDITDGCQLPTNNLYLVNGDVKNHDLYYHKKMKYIQETIHLML